MLSGCPCRFNPVNDRCLIWLPYHSARWWHVDFGLLSGCAAQQSLLPFGVQSRACFFLLHTCMHVLLRLFLSLLMSSAQQPCTLYLSVYRTFCLLHVARFPYIFCLGCASIFRCFIGMPLLTKLVEPKASLMAMIRLCVLASMSVFQQI